jgi:hypothetical protein
VTVKLPEGFVEQLLLIRSNAANLTAEADTVEAIRPQADAAEDAVEKNG